ncbi:sensor histidine kinase [Caballeronia fortuita]|uniref:Sensor histidine kinase n=1 Tax=Caballeronia fortuita TaxID=1777138 RepID=A0A158CR02_9BURK|nr:response regulator [Caballeronia fortuita]SAK84785.1 sensor histidine kinase [Caballeronia fortuita]
MLLQPDLKVLFTSGYTQNAIVHAGKLDDGVELLSKPYSRADLAAKVRHVLGTPGRALSSFNSARPAEHQGKAAELNILVVEDNELAREAVCELLLMLGHCPVAAGTATQALADVARHPFDVLLTDINLPDLSGIELAAQASSFCPGLSVIFASAEPVERDEIRSFAWFELQKPYTFEELQAVIRKVVEEADGR